MGAMLSIEPTVLPSNCRKEHIMKKTIAMAMTTLALSVLSSPHAEAADVTAAMDINSAYVWRGVTFNDGVVLQPSIDIAHGGLNLNVWGNLDVDDYDDTLDSGEFSEVDLTASYTFGLGPVEFTGGVIEYLFPNGADSTTELFISAATDLIWNLAASVDIYYDVDEVNDFYAVLGLSYSRELAEDWDYSLGVSVAYAGEDFAEFYAGGTDDGFFNYLISTGVGYSVTDALVVGANLYYSDSIDDDALPDSTVDTTFYGGVSIAYSF